MVKRLGRMSAPPIYVNYLGDMQDRLRHSTASELHRWMALVVYVGGRPDAVPYWLAFNVRS